MPGSPAPGLAGDPARAADKVKEPYLLVFSRLPTGEELEIASSFLAKPSPGDSP